MFWRKRSIVFKRRVRLDRICSVRAGSFAYKLSQHNGPNIQIFYFDNLDSFLYAIMEELAPSRCAQIFYPIGPRVSCYQPALFFMVQDKQGYRLHLSTLATGYAH